MTAIVTTDTHLTDKPQDEYRWQYLHWLAEQAKKYEADGIIHCGDLTETKDRHPARLVNRLITSISQLADICTVYILKGNHDFIDPMNPFFGFVNIYPNVNYIKEPAVIDMMIGKATFVPAGTKWNFKLHQVPYCFTHVTFNGAEAENGTLLPGVDPALLRDYEGMVYSGDIHKPQKIRKNIEYIGAPYHIRFGDKFEPRTLVLFDGGDREELHYPAPRKYVVEAADGLGSAEYAHVVRGDHVRVRVYLRRTEYDTWRETREAWKKLAEERGWVLFSVEAIPLETVAKKDVPQEYMTQEQLFEAYSKKHKLTEEYVAVGKELLTHE